MPAQVFDGFFVFYPLDPLNPRPIKIKIMPVGSISCVHVRMWFMASATNWQQDFGMLGIRQQNRQRCAAYDFLTSFWADLNIPCLSRKSNKNMALRWT